VSFAERLRQLRQEAYLTQSELAEKAGLAKATITRLEASEYVPLVKTVRALATALGVEPRALATPDELVPRAKTAA